MGVRFDCVLTVPAFSRQAQRKLYLSSISRVLALTILRFGLRQMSIVLVEWGEMVGSDVS